jgi:hypothetical protein
MSCSRRSSRLRGNLIVASGSVTRLQLSFTARRSGPPSFLQTVSHVGAVRYAATVLPGRRLVPLPPLGAETYTPVAAGSAFRKVYLKPCTAVPSVSAALGFG